VNNRSIPSTHAERKITDFSVKYSFTLYPSLSPYIRTLLLYIPLLTLTDRQNDRWRNELILVGLGNLRFLQVNPGWAGYKFKGY
jgi:hypothetical protein